MIKCRQMLFKINKEHSLCNFNSSVLCCSSYTPSLKISEYESNLTKTDDSKSKLHIPFSHGKHGNFNQVAPHQENPFTNNPFLVSYLRRVFPKDVQNAVWNDLIEFGKKCVTDIYQLGRECEFNQPYLKKYDAWGNRIDKIVTSFAWKELKTISAKEGLIAAAYENKFREYDRLYQMTKLFLFTPVSGLFSCPLAMTDGATKIATLSQSAILSEPFHHLTSRDPEKFWTSGQWMTEKKGGSDVSGSTDTVAVDRGDGCYSLFGYKWFSSATDADMTMTLANIVPHSSSAPTAKKLTMFYLNVYDENGKLNGIEVVQLKDKLGTRQVPTAELLLDGTIAYKVSDEGRGVANIAPMLTITRLHNSLASTASMRRILHLARDYSIRRSAFGKTIITHPLHQLTLSRMEVLTRGCEALVLHLAYLLGCEEAEAISAQDSMILRILTPIAKLFTAKISMGVISEGLECFGGQGYLENTGIPSILRDIQVTPIWEGTTNVLSLDMLRVIMKTEGHTVEALFDNIKRRIAASSLSHSNLSSSCEKINKTISELSSFLKEKRDLVEVASRDIAMSFAYIYAGSLLLEQAVWDKNKVSMEVAKRWCNLPLARLPLAEYNDDNDTLVMDGYNPDNVYGVMY